MSKEYQMVAALVCMDIDLLSGIAEGSPEKALEAIIKLKERKDRIINDKDYRYMRFNSSSALFSLNN